MWANSSVIVLPVGTLELRRRSELTGEDGSSAGDVSAKQSSLPLL